MKTAIITGASSGLGREMALRIKKIYPEIECCWLVARREERLKGLAAEMQGLKCETLALDIASRDGLERFAEVLENKNPDVALLINNAGCGMLGNFDASDLDSQLNMADLNVRGLTAVTRLALDKMTKGGRIINIASIASFVPNARMAVYSATKYYVRAFSRALGLELRERGISVTTVCPGPMSTEFLEVANINGNSKTFQMLPRVPTAKVAQGALAQAKKRRPVYTPGAFYKFYRVLSSLIPDTILMWLART